MSTVWEKAQEAVAQRKQDLAKNGIVSGGFLLQVAKENQQNKAAQSQATTQQGYVPSESVVAAQNNLNNLQKPGTFESPWQTQLNDVIDKIMNREKFSYDLNGDALYQQYKDQYVTQGQQAMMDTIGQASALTGGYGNSYAQSVGQQTYQGNLQQLNDKVPELYQLALDQYNREGDDLYNQYGLMADRENTDYGRYRDTVTDYFTDRDYLTGRYDSERGFDYGQYRDTVADSQWQAGHDLEVEKFEQDKYEFDTNTALTKEQMTIQQQQWEAEFYEGIRQFEKNYELTVQQIQEDIRHNKITEAQGQAQIDLAKQELAQRTEEFKQDMAYKYAALNKSSSSSGGSGGGSKKTTTNTPANTPTQTPAPAPKIDYSGWSAGQWESYFAQIRQTEGKAAAEKELSEFTSKGLIPKNYVSAAATGARGSSGGH